MFKLCASILIGNLTKENQNSFEVENVPVIGQSSFRMQVVFFIDNCFIIVYYQVAANINFPLHSMHITIQYHECRFSIRSRSQNIFIFYMLIQ